MTDRELEEENALLAELDMEDAYFEAVDAAWAELVALRAADALGWVH